MTNLTETKTIIIGFGFSCIPLLRELDRTSEPYLIISDKDQMSVWSRLEKSDGLDFDMVSSYYTTFYSFDLVKDPKTDFYPIAKDFYAMHKSYYEKYKHKIIGSHVSNIENYNGYSIVHTEDGTSYKATNVVITTGFKRKILNALATFDYSVTNKTIVFDTVGDSSNLMIAKLIAGNNKIICVTNGFLALDKMFLSGNTATTLDQLEYHNISSLSKSLYRDTILASPYVLKLQNFTGWRYKLALKLGKLLFPSVFFYKHHTTLRSNNSAPNRYYKASPIPNGLIAIKTWAIDVYAKMFGDNLEQSIKQGYLLNDLALWIDLGIVEILKKDDTIIDNVNNRIYSKDKTISFDHLIEGGFETPRLPPITINNDLYEYVPRENYFGAIPKKLSNVFIIGITRPTTGGLANITEMQCLLIHKMIANAQFKDSIYSSIDERIANYNRKYYLSDNPGTTDHLTHYGFFTEEVAKVIGINLRVRDCKSFNDLSKLLFFPNDTFKYRQYGEYKVEGCAGLVELIDKRHDRWAALKSFSITLRLYYLILLVMFTRLYALDIINLPTMIAALILQYNFRHIIISYTLYSQSPVQEFAVYRYVRVGLAILQSVAVTFINPWLFLPMLATEIGSTFLIRAFKPELAKQAFNDLKVKNRYLPFLAKYLETYRSVFIHKPITNTIKAPNTKDVNYA